MLSRLRNLIVPKQIRNLSEISLQHPYINHGSSTSINATYGVICSSNKLGQRKDGVQLGPSTIINSESFKNFQKYISMQPHNWIQTYSASVEEKRTRFTEMEQRLDNMRNPIIWNASNISESCYELFIKNLECSERANLTLNIIGDHSSAIASVMSSVVMLNRVIKRKKIVLWIDAHADINTPETSFTGNCHGMPLSIVSGLSDNYLKKHNIFKWLEDKPRFHLDNLIYVGVRDIDPGEAEIIKKHNIMCFTVQDIKDGNINTLLRKINGSDIHISFDVDSLDPTYFRSTGTPVPHGLSPIDIKYLLKIINHYGHIFKIDITEFNPLIHENINTSQSVAQIYKDKEVAIEKQIDIIVENVLKPVFTSSHMTIQ